jgi:hypothetical protein
MEQPDPSRVVPYLQDHDAKQESERYTVEMMPCRTGTVDEHCSSDDQTADHEGDGGCDSS